jgi:hypothetical protein
LNGCQKNTIDLSIVTQACNPSSWEAESGGPRILGQLGLHRETPISKNQIKSNTIKYMVKARVMVYYLERVTEYIK